MRRLDVQISTADDQGSATLHLPDGSEPRPGVLVFPGHTVEFYPAGHGFAVPDNGTCDPRASARHWQALGELCRTQLGPA